MVNVIKNMPLLNVISNVGGDAGIVMGEGETPTVAGSRRRRRREDWEDEWDDEEEDW